MAQRVRYWSCSKFADWVRGTKKGAAKTGRGWREWEEESKRLHPVRHWIAEEGLDAIQNFLWYIPDKFYDFKYYFNNRFISRTNSLTANSSHIRPGTWCDLGNRFLPCLFDELVNFVEVELAWFHIAWDKEAREKYKAPFWAWGWFRWRTWRCPQAGLDNLEWQCNLVWTKDEVGEDSPDLGQPTHQAIKAKEILELYKWWTEVYPNRPDVHDASGWTAYCNMKRARGDHILDLETKSSEEEDMCREALDKSHEIEQAYAAEDEIMMIRLIKVRNSLWT